MSVPARKCILCRYYFDRSAAPVAHGFALGVGYVCYDCEYHTTAAAQVLSCTPGLFDRPMNSNEVKNSGRLIK